MVIAIGSLSYKIFVIEKRRAEIKQQIVMIEEKQKQMEKMVVPKEDSSTPLPPPAIIQISPTDGLRIELDNTTSWNTILQLIFTLLASYLGVKLINKHVRD